MSAPPFTRRLILVLVLVIARRAQAATYYSQGSGNWIVAWLWNTERDGSGWSPTSGVGPVAADDAVIQSQHVISVNSSVSVSQLTVEAGPNALLSPAKLQLLGGATLRVGVGVTVEAGPADGRFVFNATLGARPRLLADDNADSDAVVRLSGLFQVTGLVGAEIGHGSDAGEQFELTEEGEILSTGGALVISAVIDNDGAIVASCLNTLFATTFTAAPDPDSSGRFECAGLLGARMTFSHPEPLTITAGADFKVAGGLMTFNESVTTNGGVLLTGTTLIPAKLTAAAGKTFQATGPY